MTGLRTGLRKTTDPQAPNPALDLDLDDPEQGFLDPALDLDLDDPEDQMA